MAFYVLSKKTALENETTLQLMSECGAEMKVSSQRRAIRHIKRSLGRRAQEGTSEEP